MAPDPQQQQQQHQQLHPFATDTPYDTAPMQPSGIGGNYPLQGAALHDVNCPDVQRTFGYPPTGYVPAAYPPTTGAAAAAPSDIPGAVPAGYYTSAPGVPVGGVAPMAIGPPAAFNYSQQGNEPCQCTLGWVLFGIGFVFPICWVIGAVLPYCSRNRNDKRAAIGSGIMAAIYVIAIVVTVAVVLSLAAREEGQQSRYNMRYAY